MQYAPWRRWGEGFEGEVIARMERAAFLPITAAAALMPDGHSHTLAAHGLPVGGVLATQNAVVPLASGVDIGCRMKLSVLDIPVLELSRNRDRFKTAIESETRFGFTATFETHRQHEILDADWAISPVTHRNKDIAWAQLGTSGSADHFVEFGTLNVTTPLARLPAGRHLALLTHSGSRGVGSRVCTHYARLARRQNPTLARDVQRFAWLALDSPEGQECWNALDLMGRYASANHAVIHRHIASHLGATVTFDLESPHNFARRERHFIGGQDRDVIVHRKGATHAGPGVLGFIAGSMAAPGYLVRGKGNVASLHSASHGAGRTMNRIRAEQTFSWLEVGPYLRQRGVTLLSAGLDEVPMVYKDIQRVMSAQRDLVDILGRFDPVLVKMCHGEEQPED